MTKPPVSDAGLPTDLDAFKAMVEIDIIAKQAARLFENMLPDSMTRAQFGVLNRLARLEARETITEMADAFGVSQPTMSSTVKRLLDKGLVATDADHTDGRRKVVILTDAGRQARAEITQALEPLFLDFAAQQDLLDWSTLLEQLALLRRELENR